MESTTPTVEPRSHCRSECCRAGPHCALDLEPSVRNTQRARCAFCPQMHKEVTVVPNFGDRASQPTKKGPGRFCVTSFVPGQKCSCEAQRTWRALIGACRFACTTHESQNPALPLLRSTGTGPGQGPGPAPVGTGAEVPVPVPDRYPVPVPVPPALQVPVPLPVTCR